MSFVEKTGDLFTATTDAIGHGVNCKGLMGAGIAKKFRECFPEMYWEYRKLCQDELLKPGQIFPYKAVSGRTVINIATQEYPGPDASLPWLDAGMSAAMSYCSERGLRSLAVPRIGCGIGGLRWESEVAYVMEKVAEVWPQVELQVWTP